ncbi:hypothetical protein N7922_14500 [Kosakonia sp. ML.JS2a]|uniref:hypothetical protein n=1 Tax=Kosakonia sp. ML.JS2a TaxID=2980557 RepID=UPI0021DA4043|nr:hypothetical protein [Kosakonia sp. ML.JS2a]UXY09094.1 hypothetical protein N7922_14500 [Kosakonia sp. ML.JS2a]
MAGKKCGKGIKLEKSGVVCDWEDGPAQTNYPDLTDGANCQSPIEAKNIDIKESLRELSSGTGKDIVTRSGSRAFAPCFVMQLTF